MTDITQYANPLLKQFSDKFNLGIVFDSNGVPVGGKDANGVFKFNTTGGNQKVSYSDFETFFQTAAGENANTRRLLTNGTIISDAPTVKFFFEGKTNGVFNSILAMSEAERLGASAVSIQLTALGQFTFRGNLEQFVAGWASSDAVRFNQLVSEAFAGHNPAQANRFFLPDNNYYEGIPPGPDLNGKVGSIPRDIELPKVLALAADTDTFEGMTKADLVKMLGDKLPQVGVTVTVLDCTP